MEERTGWRGQNESQIIGEEKRNRRLFGAAETSKERAEWRRLQPKNVNIQFTNKHTSSQKPLLFP